MKQAHLHRRWLESAILCLALIIVGQSGLTNGPVGSKRSPLSSDGQQVGTLGGRPPQTEALGALTPVSGSAARSKNITRPKRTFIDSVLASSPIVKPQDPAPDPNYATGLFAFFHSDNPPALWTMAGDGSQVTPLYASIPRTAGTYFPIEWSPDGTLLAILEYGLGWENGKDHSLNIVILNRKGKRVSEFNDLGYLAAWSPDSKRIALSRFNYPIDIYDVDSAKKLSTIPDLKTYDGIAWAPHPRLVVAGTDDLGIQGVYSIGEGQAQARRLDTTLPVEGPWVSSKGLVAYTDNGDNLWVVQDQFIPVPRLLSPLVWVGRFSPDGSIIVVQNSAQTFVAPWELRAVDILTGLNTLLTHDAAMAHVHSFTKGGVNWVPNFDFGPQGLLVYACEEFHDSLDSNLIKDRLCSVKTDGSDYRLLLADPSSSNTFPRSTIR